MAGGHVQPIYPRVSRSSEAYDDICKHIKTTRTHIAGGAILLQTQVT